MAMDRLSALLPNVLKKRGLHEVAVAGTAVLAAQRLLDERLPMHAGSLKARKLADKTLFLDASNAIALAECSRFVPELLEALRRQLPDVGLEAVRCLRAVAPR